MNCLKSFFKVQHVKWWWLTAARCFRVSECWGVQCIIWLFFCNELNCMRPISVNRAGCEQNPKNVILQQKLLLLFMKEGCWQKIADTGNSLLNIFILPLCALNASCVFLTLLHILQLLYFSHSGITCLSGLLLGEKHRFPEDKSGSMALLWGLPALREKPKDGEHTSHWATNDLTSLLLMQCSV